MSDEINQKSKLCLHEDILLEFLTQNAFPEFSEKECTIKMIQQEDGNIRFEICTSTDLNKSFKQYFVDFIRKPGMLSASESGVIVTQD